jgi:signal transduction histidine kinase
MDALARLASSLSRAVEFPLRAIQDNVQTAMDDTLEEPQRSERLMRIGGEVERLNQILRDVVSFATPAAESYQRVQVTELIQQALAQASEPLRQSQTQVTTDLSVVGMIRAAPRQLTQVFLNLILNAIEATQSHGQLHIATMSADDSIAILFTNDGPAIPQAEMPHVFEPFYTTKPHSTGLGLAISHNIVQQQNGMLTVENLTTGRGVTFTVKLPLVN